MRASPLVSSAAERARQRRKQTNGLARNACAGDWGTCTVIPTVIFYVASANILLLAHATPYSVACGPV